MSAVRECYKTSCSQLWESSQRCNKSGYFSERAQVGRCQFQKRFGYPTIRSTSRGRDLELLGWSVAINIPQLQHTPCITVASPTVTYWLILTSNGISLCETVTLTDTDHRPTTIEVCSCRCWCRSLTPCGTAGWLLWLWGEFFDKFLGFGGGGNRPIQWDLQSVLQNFKVANSHKSGQIIATSHDLTPNGGLVREISLFQGNLGWWNIIIWPDKCLQLPKLLQLNFFGSPVLRGA